MIKEINNIIKRRSEFIDLDRINFNVKNYKPKQNIIKKISIIGVIVFCLFTPFTNFILIPIFKLLNKFPMWLYK